MDANDLTPALMREAWDNAEVTTDETPVRKGDVVIMRLYSGGFSLAPVTADPEWKSLHSIRVHQRAVKPWARLAAIVEAELTQPGYPPMSADTIEEVARSLYHSGARVGAFPTV